jgi:ferrochelatase
VTTTTTGLLLVNLGTPDEPTPAAVRRYLREFLSDPRVLDMNRVGRTVLLEAVILPFRPSKSAHAYRQIWNAERGSPLLYHSRDLVAGVASALGDGWRVELAMRYGSPSIASALAALQRAAVDRIVVFPLYPQYASSSTGSTVARVMELAGTAANVPWLSVVPPFYDDPGFLDAFAAVGRPVLADFRPDHVLFSFHGLPERHMRASDTSGVHCLATATCCDRIADANRYCYRAQAHATARGLAARLDLADPGSSTVCFQSRLTKIPWIKPYTDVVIDDLARRGVKRVAVFCPAFVADCLETLEEIAIRLDAQFRAAGGDALTLVPSLNATPGWVRAVAEIAKKNALQPLESARTNRINTPQDS